MEQRFNNVNISQSVIGTNCFGLYKTVGFNEINTFLQGRIERGKNVFAEVPPVDRIAQSPEESHLIILNKKVLSIGRGGVILY